MEFKYCWSQVPEAHLWSSLSDRGISCWFSSVKVRTGPNSTPRHFDTETPFDLALTTASLNDSSL